MNNEELYGYIREMENLPEKEVRIYIAVADLIKEGKNINDLKVSEISNNLLLPYKQVENRLGQARKHVRQQLRACV